MKTTAVLTVLILVLFGIIAASPALADSILYNNVGPGTCDKASWAISKGFAITNSFT
jgi:hypothetical protein